MHLEIITLCVFLQCGEKEPGGICMSELAAEQQSFEGGSCPIDPGSIGLIYALILIGP